MPRASALTGQIDVKRAVKLALEAVSELFGQENITNLGLEEVVSDDDVWRVTVGFSRPWDYPPQTRTLLDKLSPSSSEPAALPEREYKVVEIDATTGELRGMEMRD